MRHNVPCMPRGRGGRMRKLILATALGSVLTLIITFSTRVTETSSDTNTPSTTNKTYLDVEFPRYFHQTWLGYSPMPKHWVKTIDDSKKTNFNIKYIRWSNDDIESLLSRDYPWFLNTYKSYSYPVQKSDAARYFILHKYGGYYTDMDIKARQPFNMMVAALNASRYDCVLPQTTPFGVSNDVIMCKAGSPFMVHVVSRLQNSNHDYLLPFVTVMASTGPLFLTLSLNSYRDKHEVFIMPNGLYTSTFFKHVDGSTWHHWDAKIINKVYYGMLSKRHGKRNLLISLCVIFTVILIALYKTVRMMTRPL